MPCIVSLDTATSCCGIALTRGGVSNGRVLGSLTLCGPGGCSRRLLDGIDYLMGDAGVGWPEVDGIAVSLGPGSFTGLRIGMATAKGLAFAAGISLYGISTLDLLAAGCSAAGLICSVVDARKKQVYTALYRGDGAGNVRRLTEPRVLSPGEFAATIDQPVLMVGDGAVLYAELFAERLGGMFCLAPAPLNQVSAVWLGFLAAELWRRGEALDLAASGPLYIRRSDAELNLQTPAGREKVNSP